MDNLLNLVRSLSAKEKSQYVKYARQHLTEKDPMKVVLFKLINQQLRGQLKDYKIKASQAIPARTLPGLKTQLYNHILMSLTHNSVKTVRGELSQMIDEIQILVDRGLLRQALTRIGKAKKMASSHQLHFPYLEISLLHRRIIRQYKTRGVEEQLTEEQQTCANKIALVNEEFELLNQYEYYFLTRRKGGLKDGTEMRTALSKWESGQIASFEGNVYFHLLEQMGYNAQKDYPLALKASQQLLSLFEEHDSILQENLPRYLRIVTNYLNACVRNGKYEEAKEKIAAVKLIKPKNFYAEAQKQSTLTSQEIVLYFHLKEFDRILEMADRVKQVLNKYATFIPFERSLGVAYNVAITFFLKKELNGALEWLNICLDTRDYTELKEKVAGKAFGIYVQGSAMVFRCIVFYEMGNIKLARNFIAPATYYLETRGMEKSILWDVLSVLKKMTAKKNPSLAPLHQLKQLLAGQPQYEEYAIWVGQALQKEASD